MLTRCPFVAAICSAFCAAGLAAGPDACRGSDPCSFHRALPRWPARVVPIPGMALLQRSSFTLPNRLSNVPGVSDRSGRNGAVILLLRRRRPGDMRHFGGEGDRHLWMAARVLPAGHEIMRATQLIARGAIRYDFVPLQLSRIGVSHAAHALEQAPRHFPQGANQR
ncbi:MAG: hypothetical protein CR217_07060 [Beijerinckiaceae bacterium]|nr:MAG: hypothetical protein CR217_07060 [Beijerinckiaceae bacterium]